MPQLALVNREAAGNLAIAVRRGRAPLGRRTLMSILLTIAGSVLRAKTSRAAPGCGLIALTTPACSTDNDLCHQRRLSESTRNTTCGAAEISIPRSQGCLVSWQRSGLRQSGTTAAWLCAVTTRTHHPGSTASASGSTATTFCVSCSALAWPGLDQPAQDRRQREGPLSRYRFRLDQRAVSGLTRC